MYREFIVATTSDVELVNKRLMSRTYGRRAQAVLLWVMLGTIRVVNSGFIYLPTFLKRESSESGGEKEKKGKNTISKDSLSLTLPHHLTLHWVVFTFNQKHDLLFKL